MLDTRLHRLLKTRLEQQIQQQPPLFPWEQPTVSNLSEQKKTSWLESQLINFQFPVELPKNILKQIFSACEEQMRSPLKIGARIVAAVNNFFPEDEQILNQLAGMILLDNPRSNSPKELLKMDYEKAKQKTQMAVLLLTAKTIINDLTIKLKNQQKINKKWQTNRGEIILNIEHNQKSLDIKVNLPTSGKIEIYAQELSKQINQAGELQINLTEIKPQYHLEITLENQESLTFLLDLNQE
jgi:hypothetical protein